MSQFRPFAKVLFRGHDIATGKDCPLGENANCTRHQLTISVVGGPTAGTVAVRGIQTGSGLDAAAFDSRLDAVDMSTLGTQAFIFYGFFEALRFDFTGFGGGEKISASIISQETDLLITGNDP